MGLLRHFLFGCLSQLYVYEVSIVQLMAMQMMSFSYEKLRDFLITNLCLDFESKNHKCFLMTILQFTVCVCLTKILIPKITTDTSSANSSKNRYAEKFIKKRNWATVVACEETADKIEYTSISHHALIVSKLPTNETTWKHCSSLPRKSA